MTAVGPAAAFNRSAITLPTSAISLRETLTLAL